MKPAPTPTIPVKIMPQGRPIQVAPDAAARKVADLPADLVPRIGVVDFQPAGDGTYRPIVRIHDQWIRVSVAARALGIYHAVLRRLITAGFVEAIQPSPGCWMMNLHSYFRHVEAVRNDPEFWNEQRRARYSAAL